MKRYLLAVLVGLTLIGGVLSPVDAQAEANFGISLFSPYFQYPERSRGVRFVRLNLFYGHHNSVTGLDVGLALNGVDVGMRGIQLGTVNLTGGTTTGLQFGIVNRTRGTSTGFQFGLYNQSEMVRGLQFGLVNQTERLRGLQFGLVNFHGSRGDDTPASSFYPIINVSW